jgi:hypothetical protein
MGKNEQWTQKKEQSAPLLCSSETLLCKEQKRHEKRKIIWQHPSAKAESWLAEKPVKAAFGLRILHDFII